MIGSWKFGSKAVAVVAASLALLTGASIVAHPASGAVTTVPGDVANDAYADPTVRAMAWNVCGEAGGSYPGAVTATGTSAYCPDRNQPDVKAAAIATAAKGHNLNAMTLEEICGGPAGSPLPATSDLGYLMSDLGAGWSFAWAPAIRRGDTAPTNGGSACRGGLTGMTGVAVVVKGVITSAPSQYQLLPNPDPTEHSTEPVLCATVAGWTSVMCGVHMVNDGYTSETSSPTDYDREVTALNNYISLFPSVILGGDFNTSSSAALAPLYAKYAECDQQAYYPGDAINEVTHFSFRPRFGANGTIVEASYSSTKIDYLFSTNGFSDCTSVTGLADQADYSTAVQPNCLPTATPIACAPTGTSDHAPIMGVVKGGATLAWPLNDGNGTTASDSSGNAVDGTLSGAVTWSSAHGGSATFSGSTAAIVTPTPVVDTTGSFTVTAWVDLASGAPTSAIVSEDAGYSGGTIPNDVSGFDLSYSGSQWQVSMPVSNAVGAPRDVAQTSATFGAWTALTAVFNATGGSNGKGGLTLYVNGVQKASVDHGAALPSNGSFAVGRDIQSGVPNSYWHGSIQQVATFRYAMTAAEVMSYATKVIAPTQTDTDPVATDPGRPGCDAGGAYGTVHTLTPRLKAFVADPNPSKSVHADFAIWDDTDSSQPQPIYMGGTGSASAGVTGSGVVSVVTPSLISGHLYGWYARTDDGTTSTTAPVCHFYASNS